MSEKRYRILAETARDAIITIDSDSRILFVNQAAEKIFGHHIAEMQGASLTMLMPDYLQHLHRAGVERYLKTGQRHVSWESVEVPGLRKNGLEIPLEISFGEYNQEGKRYFTGVCRDISERKRVQSRLATQHAVTKILAEAHEVAEAMPKIIQAICESLQWDIGELWRVDPDDNSLRCVDAWHDPSVGDEVYAGMRSEQPLHAGGGLPGRVWSSGDPIWIPDVSREQNFPHARAAADASLHSAFAFPIMLGAKIVGVMEFFSRDVKERDEEIIELISALGNQFGQFLERELIEREKAQLLAREQEARAEAENANRLKDEFLATLSHELRTPLTAIIGWSNILIAGGMKDADAARALETIYRNARAQNQLIDDLLEVSRIVTGKLRLDVQPVDLAAVIITAIDAARPAAEAKNIRLQTLLDSQASSVSGDPDRLQQVVWNLVSNAVKFTPKGGRVQIKLERVNSHIEITVADTGAGIKTEFLPYVFDRFRQSDATITRTHGGLGLGLSIVRQLVELHGGTVRAESDGEGHGATFIVSLPFIATRQDKPMMERVHPAANLGNISFECPPQLVGLRVLIVDDESDTRDLLRAVMERCGCEVTTLGTAAEALAELQQTNPDVLISDIGMPEEDGYTLIRKVRALPTDRGGGTPAIALTAYARAEDRVRALRSGFQVHVPKPVEPMELAAVVASLTRRNGQR
ncbi:MAG: ATP-binding protein [Acidobacteriota bacterium]|nr:ATP-binding protein [Acidobacteriota bacterium]